MNIPSQAKSQMDTLGVSMLLVFSILLGLNQALVKIVNAGFAPVFQSGLRSACALLPVLLFALYKRRDLSVNRGNLGWGVINGLLFSFEFCLLFLALDYTTVARVSLFFYLMPVWVAIAAHYLIPGERLNVLKVIGLGCAVAGVLVAISGDLGDAPANAWVGDVMALFGGACWAGIAITSRVTPLAKCSTELNLLFQLTVSAVVLIAISPLFGPLIREPTWAIVGIFAFQVIFIAAIGFLVWFWILSIYPVTNMASFGLFTPIFGIFFGWLIFSDPLTPTFIAAICLVGLGIVLVNLRRPT